jgi:hypothetical protein
MAVDAGTQVMLLYGYSAPRPSAPVRPWPLVMVEVLWQAEFVTTLWWSP